MDLIRTIPSLPEIAITDEKNLESIYKEYMLSNNISRQIMLIKTIWKRQEKRIRNGSKTTALDTRYFKQAEQYVNEELAVALSIPKDEVVSFIKDKVG